MVVIVFSGHVLLRFVQRVIGIRNKNDAIIFLEENKFEVHYKLLKFINESETLYENFSPEGSGETYKYFLNKDVLIVISTNSNVVVTLYDITVDLNENQNLEKIREYARRIKRNKNEFLKKNAKKNLNDKDSRNLEFLIEYKEKEINVLKDELKNMIDVSKDIALQTKQLRHENRGLMQEILFGFKKFTNN
ncbi:hypothetical protein [Lederbergia lenta]|uniref:hypothetical protein n=1 Tax=Lederbergia lenta TaxID=1467 RepID=UPI0020400DF6|nr:hypothetical protein [Lederbergia lenta]MCM3109974.1 hypothetical protein [Lederbergia lenta]